MLPLTLEYGMSHFRILVFGPKYNYIKNDGFILLKSDLYFLNRRLLIKINIFLLTSSNLSNFIREQTSQLSHWSTWILSMIKNSCIIFNFWKELIQLVCLDVSWDLRRLCWAFWTWPQSLRVNVALMQQEPWSQQ